MSANSSWNQTGSRGGVALIQKRCTDLLDTGLSRGAYCRLSGRIHSLVVLDFRNRKFVNIFNNPSVTGRVFFRLLLQGLAAPIFRTQFLDATL
jgi:hypothetical protein